MKRTFNIFDVNRLQRIWLLALYDFKSGFQGSYLGVFWAVAVPLSKLSIYFFVFGILLNNAQPSYVLYLYSGIIFWSFFADLSISGLQVIDAKKYLIENVGISKIDLFLAALVTNTLHLGFSLISYLVLSWLFAPSISWVGVLAIPIWVATLSLYGVACAVLLAGIKGILPDIKQFWGVILMGAMWLTPVIIPLEAFERYVPYYSYINPIAGVLKNIRLGLMGQQSIAIDLMLLDLGIGVGLCLVAYWVFLKIEGNMVEFNERV